MTVIILIKDKNTEDLMAIGCDARKSPTAERGLKTKQNEPVDFFDTVQVCDATNV
jgi:hypothetical protein